MFSPLRRQNLLVEVAEFYFSFFLSLNRLTFDMSELVCRIRNIYWYHWRINHSSCHVRHFRFLKDEV